MCACVKETWTTHDKVEKKRVCLTQTYHTSIFDKGSEVRRYTKIASALLFATERDTPIAHVQ